MTNTPAPPGTADLVGDARNVVIVATPGTSAIEVAGPAEAFAMTLEKLRETGRSQARGYRIHLLSAVDELPIRTSAGFAIVPHGAYHDYVGPIDTLLVVGGLQVWSGREAPRFLNWVRQSSATSRRYGSICTGAFVLAEAGLLDGQRVTTHWYFCNQLASDYPALTVDPDPIFIRNGPLSTTAGVSAGLDLALSMIEEDLGLEMAMRVARALVLYVRRPGWQSQFSSALALQAPNRLTFRDLPFWLLENIHQPLTREELAHRVSMSTRNFTRMFTREFGVPPLRFVMQLRMEVAQRLLHENQLSREEIANQIGLGSVDALERALKK